MGDVVLEIKKEEVNFEIRSSVAMNGEGGGGDGTVTRVALSVPQGFTVTGSPITKSGTMDIGFASGYSLPTTAKQDKWDAAADSIDKTYYDVDHTKVDVLSGNCSINALKSNSVYYLSEVYSLEISAYDYDGESFMSVTLPETYLIIEAADSFQIQLTRISTFFLTENSSLNLEGGNIYFVTIRGNIWDIKQLS